MTLESVLLREYEHVRLGGVTVVPPIRLEDSTTLGFGVTHDSAAQNTTPGRTPTDSCRHPRRAGSAS